jgi:mediator of replication checkpoint protein 1
MSASSTPASSQSSRDGSALDVLTPGQKVEALLAQFADSDSDASTGPKHRRKALSASSERLQSTSHTHVPHSPRSATSASAGDEDEEDLPVARRGRLAGRLDSPASEERASPRSASAGSRNKARAIRLAAPRREGLQLRMPIESSEEELSRTPPTRRLLLKRKRDPPSATISSTHLPREASPKFPTAAAAAGTASPVSVNAHVELDGDNAPPGPSADGKSKFLALVEKHRKQRLAMEAAEIAKRAARVDQLSKASKNSQRQHGSSVADSSGDDTLTSDEEAGLRLEKEARPTRKASKKALEEMNRETQRMSRNMQLAHQARTKKKITKESLLARFNFPIPTVAGSVVAATKSSTASSAPTSDAEGAKEHTTPPTSPVMGDYEARKIAVNAGPAQQELPELNEMLLQPIQTIDKGKCQATRTVSDLHVDREHIQVRPIRVKWTKEDAVIARAGDSDSDLEIITSQGKTRKYAVFESLHGRKAHETESHLMLRNLAHLGGEGRDKKRSSMNAAEMEAYLRRAARLQAQQERHDKIEELKAKGIVIQTSEDREREQQEVEDIVEKARQEGAEIQRREKEAAKKEGTYVKDTMDDDDDDDEDDGDFQEEEEEEEEVVALSGSEAELGAAASEDESTDDDTGEPEEDLDEAGLENRFGGLLDDAADEKDSEDFSEEQEQAESGEDEVDLDLDIKSNDQGPSKAIHKPRQSRVIVDEDDDVYDDDDEPVAQIPLVPAPAKTPQSLNQSARRMIPGLQLSNNSPMGLTQAFAATMADSQSPPTTPDPQAQDSFAIMQDLPSPGIPIMPHLQRLDSLDLVSDSQPATETQPLNLDFNETQGGPQSPTPSFGIASTQMAQSQMPFEPTQDAGYMLSPFAGSRFGADTPQQEPQSTIDTVIVAEGSPLLQRKGRLRRATAKLVEADEQGSMSVAAKHKSAFDVMDRASKHKVTVPEFDKAKSNAKDVVDEAAEESEDEYAGLGGASDDDVGEENDDDREMIDHDTQVGKGDEAKLAGLHADRERQQDEAAVSKLLKDITTGALRRKRGVGDDLDLSDEEDEAARRREAKRREYAKMRRELFKDEAVEKISEDKRKEAFLKSIEDRDDAEDEDGDYDQVESQHDESQSQSIQDTAPNMQNGSMSDSATTSSQERSRPLELANESQINRLPPGPRRGLLKIGADRKPSTLAEIRDSVSFLIEEPDSQSMTIDLGLSDSEDEPEKYLDLDRHLRAADENDKDAEDLGDFVVDDSPRDETGFKLPSVPASTRASYSERRTKTRQVVDRLSLMRQASSSSSSSSKTGGKMAFFASKSSSVDMQIGRMPSLLRKATTNSSFGSMAGREASATGVTVTKERGHAGEEKAFVRKGMGGQRNAVNYRVKPAESKMSERAGVKKMPAGKPAKGKKGGFLGGLFRGDSWA